MTETTFYSALYRYMFSIFRFISHLYYLTYLVITFQNKKTKPNLTVDSKSPKNAYLFVFLTGFNFCAVAILFSIVANKALLSRGCATNRKYSMYTNFNDAQKCDELKWNRYIWSVFINNLF